MSLLRCMQNLSLIFSPIWLSFGYMIERKEDLQQDTPLANETETTLGTYVMSHRITDSQNGLG